MEKISILQENQAKSIEINKIEHLENLMNKELINHKLNPDTSDFIFGDYSYELKNGTYKIRDEPLFMFKKNSKFRHWVEKRLSENDLGDYTVVYKFNKEWYDTIMIVNKTVYKDFYMSSA